MKTLAFALKTYLVGALVLLVIGAIAYTYREDIIVSLCDSPNKLDTERFDDSTKSIIICKDGYKFLVVRSGIGAGVTQMFENTENGLKASTCSSRKD